MLLSRNSGCKGTKFILNAEMFFCLFSFQTADNSLFYKKKGYIVSLFVRNATYPFFLWCYFSFFSTLFLSLLSYR